MKKKVLFGLFSLSSILLYSQQVADYTVYYEFQFITDTIESTFSKPEEFMLLRVGEESRFMTSGRYYNDSTFTIFKEKYPAPDPTVASHKQIQEHLNFMMANHINKPTRSDYKIIKNFDTGMFISIRMFSLLPVQYIEEPMNLDWTIAEETDTILGLWCTKASTEYGGRRYHAWFVPEIPINDGPYVFQGLPGLILKVTDDEGWYTFTAKRILTEKTNRYINPRWIFEQCQKIDRKTFVDKLRAYKENPRLAGAINFPEEEQLARKEAFEKRFDLLIEKY